MDLAQATQATQTVTLAGQQFAVRQLKLREWGQIQSWLKERCPSPIAQAVEGIAELRRKGVPFDRDTEQALFRQAQDEARNWPPRVATAEWIRTLESADGGRAKFIQHALEASGTALSEDQAEDLSVRATIDELSDLMRICIHGEILVPKAETGSTTNQTVASPLNSTTGDQPTNV